MDALTIKQDQLPLAPEVLAVIRENLTAAGIRTGTLYIGAVCRLPGTIYFLWHLSGEVPVSTTISREAISHPMLAQIAIQEFLIKWNQVIG